MPELPEVETIKRDLDLSLRGKSFLRITIPDPRVLVNITSRSFIRQLTGKTVRSVSRRGKALIIDFRAGTKKLVVQPLMTGQLVATPRLQLLPETKIRFTLCKGSYLLYNDVRSFGRVQIVSSLDDLNYFRILGPEPLSRQFYPGYLSRALSRRRIPIKVFLMDHKAIAGIGNIYASEILHACGIDPRRPAHSLVEQEVGRLCRSVKRVLRAAVKLRGTTMNNYRDGAGNKGSYMKRISVYGREGQLCRVCGGPVEKVVLSGRSTFFCCTCQK